MESKKANWLLAFVPILVAAGFSTQCVAQEDDYEFMPLHAWRILGETGDDNVTMILAEGFPGLKSEQGKSRWLEPVDGHGGFDNVAPGLSVEEGPGGLEWDVSPTYRTRYKNGTNYTANTTTTRRLGNNWFTRIPYAIFYSNQYQVRFDANTFRIYNNVDSTTWAGQYGNAKSIIKRSGTSGSYTIKLYDIDGKTYTFLQTDNYKCSKIEGLGGVETTISYGSGTITVLQKPSATSGSEVRKFVYTLEASDTRIDKIEVQVKPVSTWVTYRTIDFTYHDNVSSPVGSSAGDLIGIEDEKDLSQSGQKYKRKWVFKYYTGTYNESTNPGYPYQVEAVLSPGAVKEFEDDNPTLNIYQQSASQLANYVDRTYKYFSDRRLKELVFKRDCGCGGGSGTYTYTWSTNGTPPSDFNTWDTYVKITLPIGSFSAAPAHILDYNKYGQTLNSIMQEDAGNSSSRRWIQNFQHDTTGRLTDSYSVKACTSYTDSSHTVTTSSSAGMRYIYAYDSNNALSTVKLRDPANGNQNYQRKCVFSLVTSGDRRRFVKDSDTVYPTETTTDTGGKTTSFTYTYHTSDALAVKKRTTTLPTIATSENGLGTAVSVYDYFETDVLHTWHKDGENKVRYTGYDGNRRTTTLTAVDVDTDTADRPSEVPAPPDTDFQSSTGLNILTKMEYDDLRRVTKREGPAFDAWTGSSITSIKTTPRWHYTKLSGGELVVLQYPHIDSAYYHAATGITVSDYDGNVVTEALGELAVAKQNTNLDEDFDETDSTLAVAFEGTIIQRTDHTYSGAKRTKTEVWSDADNGSAAKHSTDFTYDTSGRLETVKNPAATITRHSYDVLGRNKTRKVGTVDGGAQDNMTLVEELFYDDEEDSSTNVGDSFLTRRKLHVTYLTGGERSNDYTYDYRGRVIETLEPLGSSEEKEYDNLNRVTLIERWDDNQSPSVLMAKSENFYDAWGQLYEARTYGIVSGSGTDYTKVAYWRDKRGLVIKTLSQGKVFEKTQYDGAGRVTNKAVSYDTSQGEEAYSAADDLTDDTVIEETRYTLDKTGAAELVGHLQRKHDGSGTGALDGSSGNARAQYLCTWYDQLHRQSTSVNYGTNGGSTDLTSRPSGNPPTSSSSSSLVTKYTYTIKSQVEDVIDPQAKKSRTIYSDWGAVSKNIANYVDGTPGTPTDEDRTVEYTYKSDGRLEKITAKASTHDQVTEHVYGITRGSGATDSRITSNDFVKIVKLPDPSTGAPGGADDQETSAFNALGEVIWKKDQEGTEHTYEIDDRGRQTHDRVTTLATGIDGTVRRISTTYDVLDRPVKVSSYDNATVGSGSVLNEVEYEYDKFGVVKTIWQEWTGVVDKVAPGVSPKVDYAYSFPTNGTTGLRRTSTTYPTGIVVDEIYNSGMDDTLSRLSGRKRSTDWIFRESYLGLGRLVEREFADLGGSYGRLVWTLIGTDTPNNDNYAGLDLFARVDDLIVKLGSTPRNEYIYSYNYNSQITLRQDAVGNISGSYEFDEDYSNDNARRLTDHRRGDLIGTPTIRLHECFTMDRSGNTTAYYNGTSGTCGSTSTVTFNDSNEITYVDEVPYGYNKPGDMTDRGTNINETFDAWNRVFDIDNGSGWVARYRYNGLGQMIKRTNSSSLPDTYYYYSAENQILEEDKVSDGTLICWYVWGTQYIDDIAMRATGTSSSSFKYYALDARNNVTTILNYDGTASKRYVYNAYGMPKQLSADWTTWETITDDLHLFTGRLFHKDHAQTNYRARLQDPELGVFVRRDPIGIWGDEVNFGNGYTLVGNDPGNRVDPLGYFQLQQAPVGAPWWGNYLWDAERGAWVDYGGVLIVPGIDPKGGKPPKDNPSWSLGVNWGPRLLDCEAPNYEIEIRHVLPQPRPPGVFQFWQAVECLTQIEFCPPRQPYSKTDYTVDIVNLGNSRSVSDKLSFAYDPPDQVCYAFEFCIHRVGFDNGRLYRPVANARVTKQSHDRIVRDRTGPTNEFTTSYTFEKNDGCCSGIRTSFYYLRWEQLTIEGLRTWRHPNY